VIEIVNMVQS